jgi:hypothetical protein
MQPNPLPIPPSRSRYLAPAFSQSPAPSRINAASTGPKSEKLNLADGTLLVIPKAAIVTVRF